MNTWRLIHADVLAGLATMPDESVNCCVTSPPYWGLRDYGVAGQIGLESTPAEFVERLVDVFREVRRVLRGDGTCWVNLGDSYAGSWGAQSREQRGHVAGVGPAFPDTTGAHVAGRSDEGSFKTAGGLSHNQIAAAPRGTCTGSLARTPGLKAKDLCGIPWRVALALQADGWWLRSDIIWHKPNPMPESITDRPTKAHEYVFLLTKSERYAYDAAAVRQPYAGSTLPQKSQAYNGQATKDYGDVQNPSNTKCRVIESMERNGGANLRTVWSIPTQPFPGAHFATFPEALALRCILAGCPAGGTVLDPFTGSGTTGVVAISHSRDFVGCELNDEYVAMARKRIGAASPMFAVEAKP